MKPQTTYKKQAIAAIALGISALGIGSAFAAAEKPAQVPLMSGAGKGSVIPNVVITIDNSSSMSAQWQGENRGVPTFKNRTIYELRSSEKNPLYYNPKKYYAPRLGADGTPYTHPDSYANVGKWADTTFNEDENETKSCFVGDKKKNKFDEDKHCTDRSPWAANPKMQFLVNWDTKPSGGKKIMYSIPYTYGSDNTPFNDGKHKTSSGQNFEEQAITPRHREYNNSDTVTDKQSFRYVVCKTKDKGKCFTDYVKCTKDEENDTQECKTTKTTNDDRWVVDIFKNKIAITANGTEIDGGGVKSVVPREIVGNNRPDCEGGGANGCTREEEMANIIRWYNFYASSIKAVTTAIGNAMANDDFNHKLRLGFNRMNWRASDGTEFKYKRQEPPIDRGVRYWKNDTNKKDFYDWLYQIDLVGTTPSHATINRVARYYRGPSSWKNDPTSKEKVIVGEDLDCRRAYHIFLADGGWNWKAAGPTYMKEEDDELDWKYAVNDRKTTFYKGDGSNENEKFTYSPDGNKDKPGEYIPYASASDRKLDVDGTSLSDLTAFYFWHHDFSNLPNNVATIPSRHNPTFWQNMTSFHLGWGLTPDINRAETASRVPGFTWDSLKQYQNTWLQSKPKTPYWDIDNFPTEDQAQGADYSHTQATVNDFIRAAYTGGGEAFSVYSPEDVERALTYIISLITATGDDAGVAVSGSGVSTENFDEQLRYSVSYDTASNSGNIQAYRIEDKDKDKDNKKYGIGELEWTASVEPAANRKLYALSNTGKKTLTSTTTLKSLPTDFIDLLNRDKLQAEDNTFIRYILGDKAVLTDKNGKPYRRRIGEVLGASVNSPAAFVGAGLNMGYGTSTVSGSSNYQDYLTDKQNGKSTIFAATNEGIVHVLNAGKGKKGGKEIAAYMPKGAMAHQVDLADSKFQFKYVLDGPLAVDDVYSNNSAWQQVVIGTGGRGGKYAYAINAPFDNDRTPKEKDFLWEVSSADTGYADMGYITNLSTAGQLQDGQWITLMSSGHYAGTGKVGLYVINAITGAKEHFIPIPALYAKDNRGLGGVVAVRDTNRRIVAAYAGDANGNVWRFDLRNSGGRTPVVSYNEPLFVTGDKQPIYAAPAWQVHPKGGAIVNIATGILLDNSDVTKFNEDNAIYGLWDPTPIGGDDVKKGFSRIEKKNLVKHKIALDETPANPNKPTTITLGDDNERVKVKYTDDTGSTQTLIAAKKKGAWAWATSKILKKAERLGVKITNKGVITIPSGKLKNKSLHHTVLKPKADSDIPEVDMGVTSDMQDNQKKTYYKTEEGVQPKEGVARGWYLEIGKLQVAGVGKGGERVIGDLNYLGSALLVPSVFVPNQDTTLAESCGSSSLANMLYVIDAVTGKPTKFFREFGASAVFLPAGGFARGLVVRKTSGDPIIGKTNEGYPDGEAKTCSGGEFAIVGAGGIEQGDLTCESSWTRTWRSIVNSPFN